MKHTQAFYDDRREKQQQRKEEFRKDSEAEKEAYRKLFYEKAGQ